MNSTRKLQQKTISFRMLVLAYHTKKINNDYKNGDVPHVPSLQLPSEYDQATFGHTDAEVRGTGTSLSVYRQAKHFLNTRSLANMIGPACAALNLSAKCLAGTTTSLNTVVDTPNTSTS
jgi:hypothetical protein